MLDLQTKIDLFKNEFGFPPTKMALSPVDWLPLAEQWFVEKEVTPPDTLSAFSFGDCEVLCISSEGGFLNYAQAKHAKGSGQGR